MSIKRKAIPLSVKRQVLHEAGYKCSNPVCRTILTIELHHIDYLSDNGGNTSDNLIPLCPNCHSLHHQGNIPKESLRAWKIFLITLNEALDKKSIDLLLTLSKIGKLVVSGEGVLGCSTLISADLVSVERQEYKVAHEKGFLFDREIYDELYNIELSKKGKLLVKAWRQGDDKKLIEGL